MAHGPLKEVTVEPYKTSSGKDIEIKETVKDLGVLATNDLMFKEHIGKVTTECRVIMADLMRTFSIRERDPMIKLFNSYIKSKLEYGCVIWSPSANNENQNGINMIERIQQAFTKKIEGLENLDYHQRLKECNLYSMERRRERYMIIYTIADVGRH